MHCEGTGTGDSVKASVLRALPCSRGHRKPAWDKKSGSKGETAHQKAAYNALFLPPSHSGST